MKHKVAKIGPKEENVFSFFVMQMYSAYNRYDKQCIQYICRAHFLVK